MVGATPEGRELCGACSGTGISYSCQRCGHPGDLYADGCCTRCVLADRVGQLLADSGPAASQLARVMDTLIGALKPITVLRWLYRHPAASLLARLAVEHGELTHGLLDTLPQDKGTRYARELLVAGGLLPARNEHLAQLALWAERVVAALPPHQLRVIRPFAEWGVVRDARRRAERGRYTSAAASGDRVDIRTAVRFLAWLDKQELDLENLDQAHVDDWVTAHPTRRRGLVAFIRWATARRVTPTLELRAPQAALPSQFLDGAEHHEQLVRCLTDGTLPREIRIIGALVRLYALPIGRILELTTDRFRRDKHGAYLTLDQHPVLLPPSLAVLVAQQATTPSRAAALEPPGRQRLLFPGVPLYRQRSVEATVNALTRHGLPSRAARNTAMIEAVTALPPTVISDLFGLHPSTVMAWASFAQDSWADYLAARG